MEPSIRRPPSFLAGAVSRSCFQSRLAPTCLRGHHRSRSASPNSPETRRTARQCHRTRRHPRTIRTPRRRLFRSPRAPPMFPRSSDAAIWERLLVALKLFAAPPRPVREHVAVHPEQLKRTHPSSSWSLECSVASRPAVAERPQYDGPMAMAADLWPPGRSHRRHPPIRHSRRSSKAVAPV